MKKKLVLTACVVAFACACQPKAPMQNGNGGSDDQNFQDRRKQQTAPRPQGGCCETEKTQAAPQVSQTAATPEVKVEKTQ